MTNASRSLQFEDLFRDWNLSFTLDEAVNLESIKVSEDPQVRKIAHRAITENVDSYALQMQAGRTFPPLILWGDTLIDGNTRMAAAKKNGLAAHACYRVELPHLGMARALAATVNSIGGQRLTIDEAREQALGLIEMDFTDAQVAQSLGVTAESARKWRRMSEVVERADRVGVREQLNGLNKTQAMTLAPVTHDGPFRDLVLAVDATGPTTAQVREVVEEVKSSTSDEDAAAVVSRARAEWTPMGPAPRQVRANKKAQQARMHIGGLLKFSPEELVDTTKQGDDLARWSDVLRLAESMVSRLSEEAAA